MNETSRHYPEFDEAKGWVEFLTAALPFSFGHIRKNGRTYVLRDPLLATGPLAAKHINYWTRGSIYYVTGKLLDHFPMDNYWQGHRMEVALSLHLQQPTALLKVDPVAFCSSMQLERMWQAAQDNHLDRERAIMTLIAHGIELCLKAIATHAAYHTKEVFQFPEGHDIAMLYSKLPTSLLAELIAESETFVGDYTAYAGELRKRVEEVKALRDQFPATARGTQQLKKTLEWMTNWVNHNSYTLLMGSNDPGASAKYLHSGWLVEAFDQLKEIAGMGDISSYYRYSSGKSYDELPPDVSHWGIVLARFLYEHLFPVPMENERLVATGLLS